MKKEEKAAAAKASKLRTIAAGGISKSERKKSKQPLRIRKGVVIRVCPHNNMQLQKLQRHR